MALLGAGDKPLEQGFAEAARENPGEVGVKIGFDEDIAHLMQAGADAILVPSRFEPCGLTQLYALRYGAAPVVARVGGLRDTIIDANEMALRAGVATGFTFSPVTVDELAATLHRARNLFADKEQWRQLQGNGMKTDVSWRHPARRYAELYRGLLAARAALGSAMTRVTQGAPEPLGLTLTATGANVAVFSTSARAIDLCLFDETGDVEVERIRLGHRTGDVFHAHVEGLTRGPALRTARSRRLMSPKRAFASTRRNC